nr:SLAM family member 9-like [Danio rerio]|eukprot:XP_003201040.2 SLAM family member 9-like [Danio rerio]
MFALLCLLLWRLNGVCGAGVKSVSIIEGDSVTLESSLTEIQSSDVIMWRFGEILLATIYTKDEKRKTSYPDERIRDRLKLDSQTGSLTITNSRISDSGLYTVTSSSSTTLLNTFSLTVYARLPVPIISNSLSEQYCSVLCSVVNVSAVSLSWYKGSSVLSSISVSDLNNSLSLPLEIDCLDDFYSCEVKNPISNETTQLSSTHMCQPCSDCICCCGSTEALIRLALSAVVGVASVAVLVYDIRSRKKVERTNITLYWLSA